MVCVKKASILLLSLIAIAAMFFLVFNIISSRPKKMSLFWDIPLDSTNSDILFLKGNPTSHLDEENIWIYAGTGKFAFSGNNYTYYYNIIFKEKRVRCVCYKSYASYTPTLTPFPIDIGDNLQLTKKRFGQPSDSSLSRDNLSRLYCFSKYNVFVVFRENKAFCFGIYNPDLGRLEVDEYPVFDWISIESILKGY